MKPSDGRAPAPLPLDALYKTVTREYSGPAARSLTAKIYSHNRKITHPEYARGARLCCEAMKRAGLDEVSLLRFPSDGKILYGNWKSPRIWNLTEAWLELSIRGRWVRFADWKKIPTSVFVYAAPTQGIVKTELVGPDAPSIRGRLVFCDPNDGNLEKIENDGAAGLATDYAPDWEGVRGEKDFRKGRRWDNATLFEAEKPLAGFSLSRDQGAVIRKTLAESGSIPCRFRIRGSLGDGELYCATGAIRGSVKPGEEVVAVAHLYEAGANDNASGVAASIEALRAIRTLIRKRKIPPPARTIRVIFAHEIVGFMAYFEKVFQGGKPVYVAGANPDMVGQDQKKCRSTFHFYQSPHSMATFADPLLYSFIRRSTGPSFRFMLKGFIVNDNVVSDPAIGIPCPALIHLRDRYYHSNEDDMAKVSAVTLKQVGGAMAAYLCAAASMGPLQAHDTARLVLDFAAERWKAEALKGVSPAKRDYLRGLEKRRLESIEKASGIALDWEKEEIDRMVLSLPVFPDTIPAPAPEWVTEARALIPVRTVIGPMTLQHIPPRIRRTLKFQTHWSSKLALPLFWADGKKNLYEIFTLAGFESGPYDLRDFIDYFLFLEKEKLIQILRA